MSLLSLSWNWALVTGHRLQVTGHSPNIGTALLLLSMLIWAVSSQVLRFVDRFELSCPGSIPVWYNKLLLIDIAVSNGYLTLKIGVEEIKAARERESGHRPRQNLASRKAR